MSQNHDDHDDEAPKPKSDEFAKMFEASMAAPKKKLSVGDKIKGKILVLGREDVFVSTGTQTDGVVSKRELLEADGSCKFNTGDVIDLFVTQVRANEIRLSRNPTEKNLADDLEDAFDMMMPIQGRIVEVCKGGVRVNVKGKIAFCPISQIDTKHIETADEYVGKSFEFRITQFSEGGRNIIVSRRKLLEEERDLHSGSFLEEHPDGTVVTGKVVRLEKFGAFVELAPGVDGLVHVSEIAWSRVGDPAEILAVGQEVSVRILKREMVNERMKISLSIKQTMDKVEGPDTWAKFSVGQLITGKVERKELYGLFVQLEPGVTGLLHKSRTLEHPEFHIEKLKVGDPIAVMIGEIRKDERRISLDLPRDANEEEWKKHQAAQPAASGGGFGTLGDKLQAALAKKK